MRRILVPLLVLASSTLLAETPPAADTTAAPMESEMTASTPSQFAVGVGIGWPRVTTLTFFYGMDYGATVGVEVGYSKWTYTDDDLNLTATSAAIRYDAPPMSDMFFYGMALGYKQTVITKDSQLSDPSHSLESKITTTSPYLTPYLGANWYKDGGLIIGTELGIEWAFSHTSEFESNTSTLSTAEKRTVWSSEEYEQGKAKTKEKSDDVARNTYYAQLISLRYQF